MFFAKKRRQKNKKALISRLSKRLGTNYARRQHKRQYRHRPGQPRIRLSRCCWSFGSLTHPSFLQLRVHVRPSLLILLQEIMRRIEIQDFRKFEGALHRESAWLAGLADGPERLVPCPCNWHWRLWSRQAASRAQVVSFVFQTILPRPVPRACTGLWSIDAQSFGSLPSDH